MKNNWEKLRNAKLLKYHGMIKKKYMNKMFSNLNFMCAHQISGKSVNKQFVCFYL